MIDRNDSEVWGQLVSAVTYIGDVERAGFTVAAALEEALRQWVDARLDDVGIGADRDRFVPWEDPDPLRSTIERFLDTVPPAGAVDGIALGDVVTAAIDAWTRRACAELNDGRVFASGPVAAFPAIDA